MSVSWRGRWIWAGEPPVDHTLLQSVSLPPPETWNRLCFLRRRVDLEVAPGSVPARATADSRFVLWVNGVEVARGPARSVPERLAYNEADLAPFLRTGENVIAALVRFYGKPVPWWRPVTPSGRVGYGSFAFEAPAIGLYSDSSWRGREAPWRNTAGDPVLEIAVPPTEILDGRDMPVGWNRPGFDDSDWEPATELLATTYMETISAGPGNLPFTTPEPERLASRTTIPVELESAGQAPVASESGGGPVSAYRQPTGEEMAEMTVYDAGGVTVGTPWVEVRGEEGAIVDLYAGEELRADGAVEISPRHFAMRYMLAGHGEERFEAFDPVGFRYLGVVVRGEAEATGVGATERRYPRPEGASFSCDDERLGRIWRAGARSLEVCATDAFIDCPGREQRAWVGDAHVETLVSLVSNPDTRLVWRMLRLCAHSRRPDGLLTMVAAGDASMLSTTIPDYSLHWLRALARYHLYTDDPETVRELLPAAAEVVAAFERYRGDDGLLHGVPGWVFVDWAMTERREITGALDALLCAALGDYAWLLESVGGDEVAARRAREGAAAIRGLSRRCGTGSAGCTWTRRMRTVPDGGSASTPTRWR